MVGITLTGGLLTAWAIGEFRNNKEESESDTVLKFVEGCLDLYDRAVYFVKGLFGHTTAVIEIEDNEPIPSLPEKSAGEHELFI